MPCYRHQRQHRYQRGAGLVNTLINKLPVELHLPGGYQYCGPGTRLQKRLKRGDPGINPLDAACKNHDIAYSESDNLSDRHRADAILAERAWERVRARDSSFGEKAAAWLVTNTMKAKQKFGMGLNKKKKQRTRKSSKKRKASFGSIVRQVNKEIKNLQPTSFTDASKIALSSAKCAIKKVGGKKNIRLPRIIPIPKSGGFLPLLPAIFGGLSALGALTGGAATVAKAITDAKSAGRKLTELQRHNQTMEAIAMGKSGNGLFLKPYRQGLGLYIDPPSKNSQ